MDAEVEVGLTQPCCPARPPRPRRNLRRIPPPRIPTGEGWASHQQRTGVRPLRTAELCLSELVWDGYLQAPNSRVRVRLLGWILVIVRRVVVVAWVRCEIFVSLVELCGGGQTEQVCPCYIYSRPGLTSMSMSYVPSSITY